MCDLPTVFNGDVDALNKCLPIDGSRRRRNKKKREKRQKTHYDVERERESKNGAKTSLIER